MDRPYKLRAGDRSADAVLTILRHHSNIIRSKIDVILDDTDIEALHDLRVATRRTRTALSQTKGVLPSAVVETFLREFKRVGSVTGRRRDLDVFLIDLAQCDERSASAASDLEGLRRFLEATRRREQEVVRAVLSSNAFERLLDAWGRFVESEARWDPEPPLASHAIIDVASPSIRKAYRRVRRKGDGVTANAPSGKLHRIRIDGKKLRYLLEFFVDLYPGQRISRFIKELKRLQDVLGEFNDTEVQLALIDEFTDIEDSSSASAASRPLMENISDRRQALRNEFMERFAEFAAEDSRRSYRKTLTDR